ncbi:hypothetical protein MKW98_020150, partial [Papaver atlanticum]
GHELEGLPGWSSSRGKVHMTELRQLDSFSWCLVVFTIFTRSSITLGGFETVNMTRKIKQN